MPEIIIFAVFMTLVGWIAIGAFIAPEGGVSSLPSTSRCEDCQAFFSAWERLNLFQKILSAAYYIVQKLLCIGC